MNVKDIEILEQKTSTTIYDFRPSTRLKVRFTHRGKDYEINEIFPLELWCSGDKRDYRQLQEIVISMCNRRIEDQWLKSITHM